MTPWAPDESKNVKTPVNVGQEAEHRLDVLHLAEHLGSDDGIGLEHLDNAMVNLCLKAWVHIFPIKSPAEFSSPQRQIHNIGGCQCHNNTNAVDPK